MGLNFFLLIVGLVICFGGIYFRRVVSGFMGFVWGVLLAFVFALAALGLWGMDDEAMMMVFFVGILVAILAAVYYKVFAAIHAFFASFSFSWILLLLMIGADEDGAAVVVMLVALIIAAVCSGISFKFADYSFVIYTAFTGAMIASVGLYGIVNGDTLDEVASRIMWYGADEVSAFVTVSTLILTALGIYVQLIRLRVINGGKAAQAMSGVAVNADSAGQIASAVTEQIRKAGETAAPMLQNVGAQVKNVSAPVLREVGSELSGTAASFTTAEGRSALLESLKANAIWFIAPVVAWLFVPMMYETDIAYTFPNFYFITGMISGFALGSMVYFVYRRETAIALVMAGLWMVFYLFTDFLHYAQYYFWGELVFLLWPAVIWAVVYLLNGKLSDDMKGKPVILAAVAFVMNRYVSVWVGHFVFTMYVDLSVVMFLAATIGAVYLIQWYKQKHGETARVVSAHVSQSSAARKFCEDCGEELDAADVFCGNCGMKQ